MEVLIFFLAAMAAATPAAVRIFGRRQNVPADDNAFDPSTVPVTVVIDDDASTDWTRDGFDQSGPVSVDLDPTEVDFLARTLWGEARGENTAGREAVAQVIVNRKNDPRFPNTIEGVVTQRYQFSTWNANDPNRSKILALKDGDPLFEEMKAIARRVLSGTAENRVGDITHYANETTLGGAPSWARDATDRVMIGRHTFYDGVA